MNIAVAFKAKLDAQFPDLNEIGNDDDRIPGRPVAEIVMQGLRERGMEASDVRNEEPFFGVTCKVQRHRYTILISIAGGDENDPVWQICCGQIFEGLWEGFRKKIDETELLQVLNAIEDILKRDFGVKEMRWFKEFQPYPWDEKEFSVGPR